MRSRRRLSAPQVDRTKPGSKLDFRVTYEDYQRWTEDRPGDGVSPDHKGELEKLFKSGDVQRSLKVLEKAVVGYAKGGNKEPVNTAADAMATDAGKDVSLTVIQQIEKAEKKQLETSENKDYQTKLIEGLTMAKERIRKASTYAEIAERLTAALVSASAVGYYASKNPLKPGTKVRAFRGTAKWEDLLERVRKADWSRRPSRQGSVFVSPSIDAARGWAQTFGFRYVYKVATQGGGFVGDGDLVTTVAGYTQDGKVEAAEQVADDYWRSKFEAEMPEMLVGSATVQELAWELGKGYIRASRTAGVVDVLKRILNKIRDKDKAKEIGQKVLDYSKSKNDRDDLTLQESNLLYRDVDYGDTVPLSKKQNVNIGWTDHAEYRSDLRDVDPKDVNDGIADRLKEKLRQPDKKTVRYKLPGTGTAVVDYDMTKKPVDADVITVWASECVKLAREVLDGARPVQASIDDAIVHMERMFGVEWNGDNFRALNLDEYKAKYDV